MDLQKLVDALGESGRLERANYHLTLGKAIEAMEGFNKDAVVAFSSGGHPSSPHSYRGYYSDLSFGPTDGPVTVGRFLECLKNCMGRTFEGYKGGDFVMSDDTPLWAAEYGCTGLAIMDAISVGDAVVLVTKDID